MADNNDIDHFINTDGLDSEREKTIGQHLSLIHISEPTRPY